MTSDTPLFSVIIPTRNRAELLQRAMRSVLDQTYLDFELIVADDGSADGTRTAVAQLSDPRIRYIRQSSGGPSAARNEGARRSSGEYLVFLDDDDEAAPTWLENFAAALKNSHAAIVSCGATFVDELGRSLFTRMPRDKGPAFGQHRALFLAGTYAIRRKLFTRVDGFVSSVKRGENTELALRVLPLCEEHRMTVEAIDSPLVKILRHPPLEGHHQGWVEGARYILENHEERLRKNPRQHSTYLAVVAINAARLGRLREARQSLLRSIRLHPRNLSNYPRLLTICFPPLAKRYYPRRDNGDFF